MMNAKIGILGGGVSGLSLAANLKGDCEVLERADHCAGLCASVVEEGFTFDAAGPHIMFSKNKEVLQYMVSVLGDNVHQRRRNNRIAFKGRLVKYPFENGLNELPKEDTYECILEYLRNPFNQEPTNLAEWAYYTFGRGIADKYLLPYNKKIWKWEPADTSLDWAGRIPRPPMEDVLKSAIGIATEGYLHQLFFYYPIEGGYESLVRAFAELTRGRVTNNFTVTQVARNGTGWRVEGVHSQTGAAETRFYDTLVSTLPIHELYQLWEDRPEGLLELLDQLHYNSLINVLIGTEGEREDPTAIYVPDPAVVFHRLSFPSAFSEKCVPPGKASLMAEITGRPGDGVWDLPDEAIANRVIDDLVDMNTIERHQVCYTKVVRFQYGYPISDLPYRENVTRMRQLVEARGLRLLGRFAQFDYINSDVCIERALALAAELNG